MTEYESIKQLLSLNDICFESDSPLAPRTSFRIGGNADLIIIPRSTSQLVSALTSLKEYGVPYYIAGNATNLLFSDAGYRGVVVFTNKIRGISVSGTILSAMCGDSLSGIANAARDASLSGLEFAYGIPGGCGGAVCMNAGAYGGEISGVLIDCEVYNTVSGETETLRGDEMCFSYRHSRLSDSNGEVCLLSARFGLIPSDSGIVNSLMEDLMSRRRSKQPLEFPSAGSVFKRPAPDMYVGKMLEDTGLKGYTVGGAAVSEKHAGFIINRGGATAADVLELIGIIKTRIYEKYGVTLQCEIRIIGETSGE